jgi:hypothetical protein
MESLGMELPQGQEHMVSNLGEPSGFFLDLALCPESTWLLEAATLFVGSCIFLETESKIHSLPMICVIQRSTHEYEKRIVNSPKSVLQYFHQSLFQWYTYFV